MRNLPALPLAFLLSLAACVAPSVDAGVQPRTVGTLGAASLAGTAAWPRQDWWRAYGDPQLDALVAEALAGSPDVASASARLHRAEALAGQARAALLPTLDANGSASLTKQSYNNGFPAQFVPQGYNDTGRATLDFAWELDFWGRNRKAVAAATSDVRAAEADRASAALMLSTSVASTYAQLAQLQAERAVAAASIVLRTETLKLVRQRVVGGLDTRGEERSAEAGVAAARETLGSTDESIAITRNALAALTGAGPDRGLAITAPSTVGLTAFGLPDRIGADLIGRKPEIVAARWRTEAAASRIGVARASFYPDINLAAFIGFQSLGLSNLVATGSDIGQVGPAIRLPIFDGGRLKANLRGAEADYALAVAQYDSALVRALQDVADAAASSRALTGRLADARAALVAQEDAYSIARLRYTGGLANYQSVLIAEDDVLQRRRLVADLQARAFTLDVALVRALGGGYAAPVAVAQKRGAVMADADPTMNADAKPARAKGAVRRRLFTILGVVVAIVAIGYGLYWFIIGRNNVSTDNAYVGADSALVTPLTAAAVLRVPVMETQTVKAGDVLVELDNADARVALDQAQAQLASAERKVAGYYANDRALAAQVASRNADITAADAKVQSAKSDLTRAKIDLDRRQALVASGAVSGDELTNARNRYAAAVAALATADAGRTQAAAQVTAAQGSQAVNDALIRGSVPAANPEVRAARAAVARAQLDFDRTIIRAPIAGVVAKKTVQIGQRVALGTPLLTIVPVETAYVDANFKEGQLRQVRIGQPVTLTSDLYGGKIVYHGKVSGLAGGTGAAFALIPAQNATGNWIKVVQRLPVRITLQADELRAHPLRIGLSMSADIDVSNAN